MWDDEINEVARRLTEVAPRPDLKARVVARITSTSAQRRPRMLALPATVGVTAIALITWMTYSRQPAPEEFPPTVVETPRAEPSPTFEGTRSAEERALGGAHSPAEGPLAARRVKVDGNGALNSGKSFDVPDQIAFEPVSVPMLPEAEPMTTEPISDEPLAFEALEIRPLSDQ